MTRTRGRLIRAVVAVAAAVVLTPSMALAGGTPAIDHLDSLLTASNAAVTVPAHTVPTLEANLPGKDFSIPSLIKQCTPKYLQVTVPTCAYGDTAATTTVVLYGNSQAQAWAPSLAMLGRTDHFRVVPIVKPACGVFLMTGYVDPDHKLTNVCLDFVEHSIRTINALKPSLVIVAATPGVVVNPDVPHGTFGGGDEVPAADQVSTPTGKTAASFVGFVRELRPSGAKVVLLSDIPLLYASGASWHSPESCLLANPQNVAACTLVQPTATNSPWRAAFVAAAQAADVPFIDLDTLMCQNGTCPSVIGGVVVKFNQLHVTSAFAQLVAPSLGELLAGDLPTS